MGDDVIHRMTSDLDMQLQLEMAKLPVNAILCVHDGELTLNAGVMKYTKVFHQLPVNLPCGVVGPHVQYGPKNKD